MGGHVSKNNTPGTSSGINLNANNMATELISYNPSLQTPPRTLSFNSLWQVTECLLDTNQDVVKVILDCKQDIWNEKELFELVEEYFDNSLETLDFYSALKKCLQRARDSQLPLLVALQHFEEDTEEVGNSRYARTLQGLKKFKADGDPFTEEFFQKYQSVYDQQKLMLEKLMLRKNKLDKKLKYTHTWRKVSTVIFVVTAATLLICPVAFPKVAAALAVATAIPMAKWIDSLWKECANADTCVAKSELDNIRVLINRIKDEIESLSGNVDFAIEQEAVKVAIEEIKKKLGDFMEDAEDLGVQADKCSRDVMAARKEVLQRIKKPPHT